MVVGDARFDVLAQVGRRFSGAVTRDELVDVAAEAALEVLVADSVSVSQLEPEHGLLRVVRNAGALASWEEEHPQDEVYSLADFSRLATSAEHARPWSGHRDEVDAGPAYLQLLDALGMDSSVSIPVVVGDRIWGEIGAARRAGLPRYGPDDLSVGMVLAGMFAAALGGLGVGEELRRLAYHDGLTGLGNRRAVDEQLERLFSAPLSGSLGLLLCDVNELKDINDTHGHHVGDRVLRDVAVLLTREAGDRPGSLAARIGGDEFALIIEDTDDAEMEAIAHRLSDAAADLALGAGVSCGTAVVGQRPGDAPTATASARALLRLADAAQYRSKRSGVLSVAHAAPDRGSDVDVHRMNRVAAAVLPALASLRGAAHRLEHVASTLSAEVGAAGWAVSVSERGGPVTIVVNGDARQVGHHEDHPLGPGSAFDPGDYPATLAALAGGSFHATLDHGDPAEREFLAAYAYDEAIGAGTADGDRAWLVEVAGDASSPPLAPYEALLRVLVELAVHGQPAGGTDHPGREAVSARSAGSAHAP